MRPHGQRAPGQHHFPTCGRAKQGACVHAARVRSHAQIGEPLWPGSGLSATDQTGQRGMRARLTKGQADDQGPGWLPTARGAPKLQCALCGHSTQQDHVHATAHWAFSSLHRTQCLEPNRHSVNICSTKVQMNQPIDPLSEQHGRQTLTLSDKEIGFLTSITCRLSRDLSPALQEAEARSAVVMLKMTWTPGWRHTL